MLIRATAPCLEKTVPIKERHMIYRSMLSSCISASLIFRDSGSFPSPVRATRGLPTTASEIDHKTALYYANGGYRRTCRLRGHLMYVSSMNTDVFIFVS